MSGVRPGEAGSGKIFPRNLTARADFVVRGNPANTRLESGVDNCYPGLEFDQRNLDKAFFPGLSFEFHRSDGAILERVVSGGAPEAQGLSDADRPLYLWALFGRTALDQSEDDPPAFFFLGSDGLEVWRRVHDLLPGRIAVLLGPEAGISALPPSVGVIRLLDQLHDARRSTVRRDGAGRVTFAILTGERAAYLDDDGVIDLDVYPPGELTRSLCSPWQFDFRDCGCFYWAASKPDLVTSADGRVEDMNFQRRDRTPTPDLPTQAGRRELELDYGELIHGWNDLPVVVDDRETDAPAVVPDFDGALLDRDRVAEELAYLATVEHALCVQYLYAHYSLDAPMTLPEAGVTAETRRIFAAAGDVFAIAVDEMRHLRWANEALTLLGRPPSVGRAERIGRAFDRPFALAPLTPAQLQWFVDVEAPSQSVGQGLDGMYVRLHASVDRQPQLFSERDRLVHLLKLIIDEGQDHHRRFQRIQRHLLGIDPAVYLRPLDDPPGGGVHAQLQRLSDQNYAVVLGTLQTAFSLGDRAGGVILEQSRRVMFNLHETNHLLARQGFGPHFTLPALPEPANTPAGAHALVDDLGDSTRAVLADVAGVAGGGSNERELAARQTRVVEELFDTMHRAIEEDLGP